MTADQDGSISLASIGRSAAILTVATIAVQLVGIVRELFLAAEIGVSPRLDALIIGIALPTMVAAVFTAGTRTALVPAYMGTRDSQGPESARRVAGTVLVWVSIAGIIGSIALAVLAEPLIALTGPGLAPVDAEAAVGYVRIVAPLAFLTGVSAVLIAVCQAEELFDIIAAAMIVSAAVAVGVMFALWEVMGLDAVAVGTLVGPAIGILLMLVVSFRRHITPIPHIVSRGLGLSDLMRHAVPLTLSAGILQLNRIFDRAIATIVAPGAVSVLRFGDSLLRAPMGAISPAWSNAMYPSMVQSARRSGAEGLGPSTERILHYTIAVFVPVALLSAAVAPVATAVVYGRGAFGDAEIAAVSRVLVAFAPLVFLTTIDGVLTPALNARRRGLALLAAGMINVTLNLFFDVVFGLTLGVVGIALSSTVTAAIVTTWKLRRFVRGEEGIKARRVGHSLFLALAASAPGAIAIALIAWNVDLDGAALVGLAGLAVAGVAGLTSYVVFATILGFREPSIMLSLGIARLRRR